MSKLNKNDIIYQVSEEAYLSVKDAKAAVDLTFKIISDALVNNKDVDIANFASFKVNETKATRCLNPNTHQLMEIKPKRIVSMKVSNKLKNRLNNGK